jgi:hypothetical protein
MANFAAAYQARDLGGYAALLHDDFRFVVHAEQRAALDPDDRGWSRTEELTVTARMFSDAPVTKEGRHLPPITAIVFDTFAGVGEWRATGPATRFPHALVRTYRASVRFERAEAPTLHVRGDSDFYCVADPPVDPGLPPRYRLIGWVDRTRGAGGP